MKHTKPLPTLTKSLDILMKKTEAKNHGEGTTMKAVWKYPLTDMITTVEMPTFARVLDVQNQEEIPTLWALVHPENVKEKRTFRLVETGDQLPDHVLSALYYRGTVQLHNGTSAVHVFEVQNPKEEK